VLAGDHSAWLADIPTYPALSLYVAERSILRFDSDLVDRRLYRAGFVDVEMRTMPGWQRASAHLPGAQAFGRFVIIPRRGSRWRPGRDARAMCHPATPGAPRLEPSPSPSLWQAAALPA
jgi:hypothetical protein